jgi:hypothetical protein
MRRRSGVLAAGLLTLACSPEGPGKPVEDPALEKTARDVVAMLGGYNCELLPRYLARARTPFFGEASAPS